MSLRVALTQTVNAYRGMPASVDELDRLEGKLDALREANLAHHAELVRHAAQKGARVIGLGELFPAPYFALERRAMWRGLAEDLKTGPTVKAMSALARELSVIIVAPFYELAGEERINTAAVIDEEGRLLGSYRKTHIPQGGNELGEFHETLYYGRSDGKPWVDPAHVVSTSSYFPVFRTSVCRLGVAICYDRHFEGVMSSLAAGGAELVLCPAVTFGEKSQRLWHLEFPVDAMRHKLFIAGSNRLGREPPFEVSYFGQSYVVGPNGVCDDLSDHPNLVIADIDLAVLGGGDPSGWDLPRDRRTDIYTGS
jgi:N-carbamoylputrescine amidase